MIESRVEVTSRALQRLALVLRDRRRINRQVAAQLNGWVFRNFKDEGKLRLPGGWEPLSPATLLARLRKSPASAGKKAKAAGLIKSGVSESAVYAQSGAGLVKILQDTGALRNSFAPFSDNDIAGIGAQSNAEHANLAIVHEYGNPSRNIPARPMLPTPAIALDIAMSVYRIYLQEQLELAHLA
jgi:phage gpG-like protein